MKYALPSFLASTLIFGMTANSQKAYSFSADDFYIAGTDAGMLFLAEHSGRLRLLLLAQECGHDLIAETLSDGFPQSFDFALASDPVQSIPHDFHAGAAQVARAYVVGYETGVRTEFQRHPPEYQRHTCEVVAMAAGSMFSQE